VSRERCGDVAARVAAALLQQALWQRCGAAALLQPAAMTESSALCNDGQCL